MVVFKEIAAFTLLQQGLRLNYLILGCYFITYHLLAIFYEAAPICKHSQSGFSRGTSFRSGLLE